MNPCLSLLSSLLLLLGLACSPKTSSVDLSLVSPEEIIHRVKSMSEEVSTFWARGSISVENVVGTGSITVAVKRPDSLLIKVEGPFGIDIGSMLLTNERFTYFDSHTNRVIMGRTTRRNIRSLLRIDLDLEDVLEMLSGTTSMRNLHPLPDSISAEDGSLVFQFNGATSTARYWIDPEKSVVVRYELLENETEPVLDAQYSRFTEVNRLHLPRLISIVAHREKRGLTLLYHEIKVNNPNLDFSLTIPENARRVYW
jgi:outer membrane lipoprotein-sorting protein